tara:strand:- start:164 stop:1336 length:1173 start_codon:yes stop_codon:yes gene_type:complete
MNASRAFIHFMRASRRRARRGGPKNDRRRPKTTDVMTVVRDVALTDQEAAVYDRQIRVWGVETQRALRAARVLVSCGRGRGGARARGLCAETLKNVVLAGVGEMTIRDDAEEGSETSFGTDGNFLNQREDGDEDEDGDDSKMTLAERMRRTLAEMNPFANVRAETTNGRALDEESDEYFGGFDCVVAVGYSRRAAETVNAKCRDAKTRFFAGFCGAFASYFFVDLGDEHAYTASAAGGGAGAETFRARFAPMSTAFGPDGGERDWAAARKKTSKLPFAVRALWDFERAHGRPATEGDVEAVAAALRETATRAGKDAAFVPEDVVRAVAPSSMGMPAIDAVVGGILGQEILKAVSGKGAPCVNFFVFDAASGCGTTFNASGVEQARASAAV